uniref:Uncharacterized protein n=1 Tax=Oryza brachyantha TaxID=4533 RepID=J3LRD3_ORYBR
NPPATVTNTVSITRAFPSQSNTSPSKSNTNTTSRFSFFFLLAAQLAVYQSMSRSIVYGETNPILSSRHSWQEAGT